MLPDYSLQKHDQYGQILLINGKESICPFKPALTVPTQNALGQVTMQIINFPCCTSCPHAQLEQLGLNDQTTFNITCHGSTKDFDIVDDNKSFIDLV